MLESIDVVKVLGYGLSGFAFLLVFLAFMLLRKEQEQNQPRKLIVQTIQMFMGLCLILSVVVGVLTVPVMSDNSKKANQIASYQTNGRIAEHLGNNDSNLMELVSKINEDSADKKAILIAQAEALKNIEAVTDELEKSQPDNKEAIEKVSATKNAIATDFSKISTAGQHEDTVKAALQRIQMNNRKVRSLAIFSPLILDKR